MIKVVSNYFGIPPDFFQLWLDSCAANPAVTWMFYTDIRAERFFVPPNVVFINTNLSELKARIQLTLPYEIRYEKAWDFCALKPILGHVLKKDLADADYWGWSDIDMIYGDVTPCITALRNYDKVMPKGHLSFIRNNSKINQQIALHELSRAAIARSEAGLPCYDEVDFPERVLPALGYRQDNSIPFINTACRPGHFVLDDVAALEKALGGENGQNSPFVATWSDGKMFGWFARSDRQVQKVEVAYFHFFRREMCPKVLRLELGHHYLIVPNQIREYDGHSLTWEEIVAFDRFRIHYAYWRKRLRLKKIIKKVFCK